MVGWGSHLTPHLALVQAQAEEQARMCRPDPQPHDASQASCLLRTAMSVAVLLAWMSRYPGSGQILTTWVGGSLASAAS